MATKAKAKGSTVERVQPTSKQVTGRVNTSRTAKAEPRAFIDYTVWAKYGDGSEKVIGTVEDFASCDALKSEAITQARAQGHGIPTFRVVERDYDDSRDAADHMIESEVQ